MKISLNQPGLAISVFVHVATLIATLFVFSDTQKFEDAQEAIAVEVMTDSQANDIIKGDKTSKDVKPVPKPKVDKLADVEVTKPTPPTPDAKRDVPTPPPVLKRIPDPGQDEETKPEPPKPEPPKPPEPKPVPKPPEPPKPEPPKPPEPVKPIPTPPVPTPPVPAQPRPDAEIVRPSPQQKQDLTKLIDQTKPEPPKPEPPKPPKVEPPKPPVPTPPVPTPPVEPKVKVRPHSKPDVPKPPDTGKAQPKLDDVAKLLDQKKLEDMAKSASAPATKAKSGEEKSTPAHSFNVADINKLLSKEPAQSQGSTGKQVNAAATAGATNANSDKMSPNVKAQLDGWLVDRYHACWDLPITLPTGARYVPKVLVNLNQDGSLAGSPQLLNPPSDPAYKPLADSAVRAVMACNPLKMPPHFQPYYSEWKSRAIVFDPEDH